MRWTEKQREAINIRGENALVAAAAGSGKTAVLVERIKEMLIKEYINVDEILVVTFTNAAAAEMREKIIDKINEELSKSQISENNNLFLQKQLNLINTSNISTFHAFAMKIIKRFFQIALVEPDFKICDNAQQIILQEKSMNLLFEQKFEQNDCNFIELLNLYASSKNEDNVKNIIMELYRNLMSIPNSWQWLEENVEELNKSYTELYETNIFKNFKAMVTEKLEIAENLCYEAVKALNENYLPKLEMKLQQDYEGINLLKQLWLEEKYDDVYKTVNNFKYARMNATKDEKEGWSLIKEELDDIRNKYKKIINNIKEEYLNESIENKFSNIKSVYKHTRVVAELVKNFYSIYNNEKRKLNLLDFSDIEHLAIKILEDDKVSEEYKKKFKYIFIDEYQDSNLIQDMLISKINRGNNVFMVGDVKQSIYKFRLAEPEIFEDKYKEYSKKENEKSRKIDLNSNFRSKKRIINCINSIFSKIMKNYDENAFLNLGIEYKGESNYNVELHIIEKNYNGEDIIDEDIIEMKTPEEEGYFIGSIINETLGKTFFDNKLGVERKFTKKDIVILLRSQKNYADKIQEKLKEMGIVAHISENDGYFNTTEIEILINFLKIIVNRYNDIELISTLYSPIFNFTVYELSEIRVNSKEKSFFESFVKYPVKGNNELLIKKIKDCLNKIRDLKEISRYLPIEEFLWMLLDETGYYQFVGALPQGEQRRENVLALLEKAREFQKNQMKGLYGFIRYIEALKNKKISIGEAKIVRESDDVVRIMTIHKSKGLEFPMVIVAGMGRNFNRKDESKPIDIHKNIGIGMPKIDINKGYKSKTLIQHVISYKRRKEDIEEQIRVLYVAFTRAKDKLVLLGSIKDYEKISNKINADKIIDITNISNYLDCILPYTKESGIDVIVHKKNEINLNSRYLKNIETKKIKIEENELQLNQKRYIEKHIDFKYSNEKALKIKSKLSVTDINKKNMENPNITLAKPLFLKNDEFTAAQKGSIIHTILENWDFKKIYEKTDNKKEKINIEAINFINMLVENKYLTKKEGEQGIKDIDLLVNFQLSDLGVRISKSDEIIKEMPFNMLQEIEGESVIVQGVIDCFFLEKGKYILVDYKSTSKSNLKTGKEKIREMYKKQIEIYAKAIEKSKKCKVEEKYLYMLRNGEIIEI